MCELLNIHLLSFPVVFNYCICTPLTTFHLKFLIYSGIDKSNWFHHVNLPNMEISPPKLIDCINCLRMKWNFSTLISLSMTANFFNINTDCKDLLSLSCISPRTWSSVHSLTTLCNVMTITKPTLWWLSNKLDKNGDFATMSISITYMWKDTWVAPSRAIYIRNEVRGRVETDCWMVNYRCISLLHLATIASSALIELSVSNAKYQYTCDACIGCISISIAFIMNWGQSYQMFGT